MDPATGGPQARGHVLRKARKIQEMADRRQRVWDLYKAGELTMREIAERVGVSVWTVHEDFHAVRQALQACTPIVQRAAVAEERQADIYEEVILDNARLRRAKDRGIRRDAHETLLQALRDEQRFYGLGKREETVPASRVVDIVLGLTEQFLTLFAELVDDEHLRRRWADAVSQRVRQRLGTAIDVTPRRAEEAS